MPFIDLCRPLSSRVHEYLLYKEQINTKNKSSRYVLYKAQIVSKVMNFECWNNIQNSKAHIWILVLGTSQKVNSQSKTNIYNLDCSFSK